MLSFVPEPEQRGRREVARAKDHRAKDHYGRERVQVQNRIGSQLEGMRIRLSGVIGDLPGNRVAGPDAGTGVEKSTRMRSSAWPKYRDSKQIRAAADRGNGSGCGGVSFRR